MADTLIRCCQVCNIEQYITEFKKKKTSSTGYLQTCKKCINAKEQIRIKDKPPTPEQLAARKYRSGEKSFKKKI